MDGADKGGDVFGRMAKGIPCQTGKNEVTKTAYQRVNWLYNLLSSIT